MGRDVSNAMKWLRKGIELTDSERFEEAIKCFEEALKEDPECGRAWFYKGGALAATLRFEDAAECYQKATEIDPKDAAAWYGWGLALVAQGDFGQAIQDFDEAISIDPHLDGVKEDRQQALKDLARFLRGASIPENDQHTQRKEINKTLGEADVQTGMSSRTNTSEELEPASVADYRGKVTPRGTRSTKKTQGRRVVLKCMVCKLPLRFGNDVLWCPYCGTLAHRTHLLEWLHVKKRCPSCGNQLREEDLVDKTQKSTAATSKRVP